MAVIILAGSNQNYTGEALMSQGVFWGHGTYDFLFPTFAAILDLLAIVTLVPTVLTRNGPHSLGQCIYFMV
jgi:hypothetical protein